MSITTYATIPNSCINLFDQRGNATQPLVDLLTVTKIQIPQPPNISNIAASINIQNWRNHPHTERWHFKLPDELKDSANNIIMICKNTLGMQKAVLPKHVKYSGVLFLGATLNRVVDRAIFYKKLINTGIIDQKLKVWILTGERTLDEKVGETTENFLKFVPAKQKTIPLPTNELEMIKFVFYYLLPKEIEVEYIYSTKDQHHTRATTTSTTYEWAKNIPNPRQKSYYLAISNQPYVNYQETIINLVLKKLGKENIEIQAIGDEAHSPEDQDNYAAILLDTVAKIIATCSAELLLGQKQLNGPAEHEL